MLTIQNNGVTTSTSNSSSTGSQFTFSGTSNSLSVTKPRSISIEPKANGYCLNIGCQTFVFESLDNLVYRIHEYYSNPAEVELHFESTNKLPTILSKKEKTKIN